MDRQRVSWRDQALHSPTHEFNGNFGHDTSMEEPLNEATAKKFADINGSFASSFGESFDSRYEGKPATARRGHSAKKASIMQVVLPCRD